MTARGVKIDVQYSTRAYVQVREFVFQHPSRVWEILPDVVLWYPWL